MKRDIDVKQRLIESARDEFAEKGFLKASLRNICKTAEVTTGAVYFFFKDKADLFAAVLEPVISAYESVLKEHASQEAMSINANAIANNKGEHDNLTTVIFHLFYKYRTEADILLNKAEGTQFEGYLERQIAFTEVHHRNLNEMLGIKIDDKLLHWFSRLMIYSYVSLMEQCDDEAEALKYSAAMMEVLSAGYMSMLKGAENG